jgi:antitoxin component of MazEF toxin-antitoxin module
MTTYTRKIGRRGSGLWIRIPAAIVRKMNLKVGDEAEIVKCESHGFELRCTTGGEFHENPAPPSESQV